MLDSEVVKILLGVRTTLERELYITLERRLAAQLELNLNKQRVAELKKDIEELDQQIKEQA